MTKAIVTDIEGTTSSIAFVKDVLFPYAARNLPVWVKENHSDVGVQREIAAVAETLDRPADDVGAVINQLLEWIEQDVKATPLKTLQGMLWKSGYESGDYRAHVYEDAVQKLQDWHSANIPLYVYSSGSVQAQELFFQYSEYGDLRNLFSGYFDTTTGPKSEADSYRKIAVAINLPATDILFLSDIESEVGAALATGMKAVLVVREHDSSINPNDVGYDVARNFHEVSLET
jgi:enolase-phosphatase E1